MMDLDKALKYYEPQVNRILAIEPAKRTHQDQAFLALVSAVQFMPTHQHKVRGTFYQVLGEGKLQVTLDKFTVVGLKALDNLPVTFYRGMENDLWARPVEEFNDGRFEVLLP